ncbi:unnamed protein product [Parnassius apollo]|uniref:(apollo) hypothetical protein n=1 Tax=Parnassius apollo TaxID=110799 RepID=A0A8S3Y0N3_PARAO|nr:unnamed protein product [Parnassius apollo]
MTYMFEYPQFVRISLDENKLNPQYGLYAYSEGRFTEKARKMWFDGIPVLFVPGNSGSHMQARSLASVALRKALAKGYEYHFDFFTISYNEELSGLYGGVLQSQTDFAAACVSKILSLYKSNRYTKSVPTSVILIGHSMGGVITKRLLAYYATRNSTDIAITLAAPLEAPVINFDVAMNNYYMIMDMEWELFINQNQEIKNKKMLISFGSGPRDLLIPAGLTSTNDSFISVLTTAVPGVWVSPDHVSMVWCKQLVMAVNRYLFDIVNMQTEQISNNRALLTSKARQYFQANRSMTLSPHKARPDVTLQGDAFWYEDNRRIYQINRPDIDRTTFLMIRLVSFPQNRFVAVESVNVDDKDWIFGCNAKYTHSTYRHCKEAKPLSELSRWSGAANDFGRRKLATVHLHNLMDEYPEWTHVVVKVSPTKKPITLNVDINDYASRRINVNLPLFGRQIVKQETETNSLYYELILTDMNVLHQAYLLYVEPTPSCQANHYHVSAEMHVPWAKNNEYYHYFTHLKRTPMKLRLFKSNPNVTLGMEALETVKVTLLLDPKCTFTISISTSWYHRLAQIARNYTPVLFPFVAAIVLLAVRSSIIHLKDHGTCLSIHGALMSESVKPYYALVFARLGAMVLLSVPFLEFLFENASWKNLELHYFIRSLLVLPMYMTALGIVNVAAAAILAVMVFWSQLAHRLLFRIVWRGGSSIAEKMASGLQKVPMAVSAALVCTAPVSCGAASLAAGAAFYAFMLSKMYEDYLEDYVYKLMAKLGSKICRLFKSRNMEENTSNTDLVPCNSSQEPTTEKLIVADIKKDNSLDIVEKKDNSLDLVKSSKVSKEKPSENSNTDVSVSQSTSDLKKESQKAKRKCNERGRRDDESKNSIDQDLNNLNFHMMLFFLWLIVTAVNIPALLTWARNFKYSMVLKSDTSYHTGLVMSVCSAFVWQMDGPRQKLRYYEALSSLIFTMALFVLVLGIFSLFIVNYGVTLIFALITMQQLWDYEEKSNDETNDVANDDTNDAQNEKVVEESHCQQKENNSQSQSDLSNETPQSRECKDETDKTKQEIRDQTIEDCNVCSENRIYNIFKHLRDKFSFNNNDVP